ncbi:hemolysin D [Vibrio sp. MACH09]|nr:hemolysin D [Vibrio sp. MACH09]
MISGSFSSAENVSPEQNTMSAEREFSLENAKANNSGIYTVRVKQFEAEMVQKSITLNGRTEPYLSVTVASEIEGKITAVYAKRGSVLKAGDLIAKIDVDSLQDDLEYAQADLKQKEAEQVSAQKLAVRGFQGKIQLEKLRTEYKRVKAQVAKLKRSINKSTIRSPQDGVMNERFVEVGDYVSVGQTVAGVEKMQPLIVAAEVTEKEVYMLMKEQQALVTTVNNETIRGHISYLSSVSNRPTNTFTVEIEIPNHDNKLFAGTSAKVELPTSVERAIKVSPSILVLSKEGGLGVKTVTHGKVDFKPIDILKTEHDGVWLKGLEQHADIIILGQGFVSVGESVNIVRVESNNHE